MVPGNIMENNDRNKDTDPPSGHPAVGVCVCACVCVLVKVISGFFSVLTFLQI